MKEKKINTTHDNTWKSQCYLSNVVCRLNTVFVKISMTSLKEDDKDFDKCIQIGLCSENVTREISSPSFKFFLNINYIQNVLK